MRKTISPMLGLGMLIFLAYAVTDRFIAPLSELTAIPWIALALIFIIVSWLKNKKSKEGEQED